MDAFEQLVSELLWLDGYWSRTSFKVRLTPEDKSSIERPSCPAWELDIVACRPADNEILVVECKSFLDSTGVTAKELTPCSGRSAGNYKLFCEERLRKVVLNRLAIQCTSEGLCMPEPHVSFGLAVGKFKNGDEPAIEGLFQSNNWKLFGPKWLTQQLKKLSAKSYENEVSSVVAKLLLRS